jgi:hypothetical protein
MLTATAIMLGLLLVLASPSAMGRQVGVKAPSSPVKPAPKINAPPSKPTKKPVETRPAPKTPKSKSDEHAIATYPVLSRIETYKSPPYPKNASNDRELYDYRIRDRNPVPATLPDVLACDIWQRITKDLKLKVSPKEVSEETISQAMNIYLTRNWRSLAGYRPWTHWNFIRGLNVAEREALAKEITEYIKKNGVRDVNK